MNMTDMMEFKLS